MSVNLGSAVAFIDLDASKFESGLKKTVAGLKTFNDKTLSTEERFTALGSTMQSTGKKMTLGVTAPLAGIGAVSIKTAADFESSMLQVGATMGITANEIKNGSKEFKMLEDAAKEMGSTTEFSASQSAEALNYLALAGFDAEKSVAMLPKILDLAAAGGMDLATASDMVTDSMSALSLSVNEADGFIDKMAKTSQKSNTSVEQLGNAILTVGGTAKSLSGGVTEMNTVLGIFADNGIKGAEGGTALRNMILALTPETDKAIEAFDKLNVETYDANGNLKPLNETFGEMNDKLKDMSQEDRTRVLSDIFNKVDLKSVNALLGATNVNTGELRNQLAGMGVDTEACADTMNYLASTFEKGEDKASFVSYAMEEMGITTQQATAMYDYLNENVGQSATRFDELSGYISDADGAASDMAETMNSGLNGQLTSLKSALEGAAISIGEALAPAFEVLVSWVQSAVDWFNSLDSDTQTLIATFGAIVAAIGPVLMIGGLLIQCFGLISGALSGLGGIVTTVTGFFGGFGSAAVGVNGPLAATGAASTVLGGILKGGLIGALIGVIAKIGDSEAALGFLQDKFGSLGTIIGAVCEFISGIWDFTMGNLVEVGKLALDVLAAMIDGPGGAKVSDAMDKFTKGIEENNKRAWEKVTLDTTRELSQTKANADKETKDTKGKVDKNTKDMADSMSKNSKKGADDIKNNMQQTSKVVMDESGKIPKDVQSNMDKSVQAMRQAGSDIYNGMNTSFSKLASQGKQHFSGLCNGTTRSSEKMANDVIADWNRIKSALSGTITGNVQIKVHGVQAALNQINSVKNASKQSLINDSNSSYNYDAINLLNEASNMLRGDSIASYSAFSNSGIEKEFKIKANAKKEKQDNNSERPININLNIEKMLNSDNKSIETIADELAFHLRRKNISIGGVR